MVLGKVRALAIYFDSLNENNLPVFSGGDLVSGRVVVEVTGDVRVKSLDIHARGVAKVRWTESRNAGANTTYTQNYTEEVEYLHHYDTLIGEERGERGVVSQCVCRRVCAAMQKIALAKLLPFRVFVRWQTLLAQWSVGTGVRFPETRSRSVNHSGADATADS